MKQLLILLVGLLWGSVLFGNELYNLHKFLYDDAMLVSNSPESIKSPGLIYQGMLPDQSLRVIYYHQNIANQDFRFDVAIQNKGASPAVCRIYKGISGPSHDGLFVGHKATQAFFRSGIDDRFEVIRLNPGQIHHVSWHQMKPDQVISGLLKFVKEPDSQLQMTLRVVDPKLDYLSGLSADHGQDRFDYGYYTKALDSQIIELDSRAPILELPVGNEPFVKDVLSGKQLHGNYGLCYAYVVTLKNTLADTKRFSLYFAPVGGIARAGIILDGQLIETGLVDHRTNHQPTKIQEFDIDPGQSRQLYLATMPQPGSFYPVNLVITNDGPKYKRLIEDEI